MLRAPGTVILLFIVLGISHNEACADSTVTGVFIDRVIFYHDPQGQIWNESPPESMKGIPDGLFVDLDGGGTTVSFADTPTVYDWITVIPEGTQLILVDMGPGRDDPPTGTGLIISYGYGVPADNGDGVAGNARGKTRFLGSAPLHSREWSRRPVGRLLFYAFDAAFKGVTPDFFLSVDDFHDQEIDAVFIFSSGE